MEKGRPLYFCPVVSSILRLLLLLLLLFLLLLLLLLLLLSSPNLSGRRVDVYRTSTHGVALVRI